MKWSPQAVVAVMLGFSLIIVFGGEFVLQLLGKQAGVTAESADLWKSILGTLIGGLIAWIGTHSGPRDP